MAAAIPSRCVMPRENPPARLLATSRRPTRSSTSSARLGRQVLGLGQEQQVVAGAAARVDAARLEQRTHPVSGFVSWS